MITGGGGGKVFGSIPWTDEEHFRDTLARVWVYYPDRIDWASFPERDLLNDLLPLVGPIAALQLFGTAEAFERRADCVSEALAFAPTPVAFRAVPHTEELQEQLEAQRRAVLSFAGYLNLFTPRMRVAERELQQAGWRFNPDTRRVERIESGNRPFGLREG